MAFNISYIYQAVDKFTPVANKIKRATAGISKKITVSTAKLKKFGQTIRSVGSKAKTFGRNLALKLTAPIAVFSGFALKASANMETLRISLESMTGSSEKAAAALKAIVAFTAETPFQLEGVGKAAKQLLSFGVFQDELIDKLRFLGDIAAGANVPLTDMAAIFGKAKAKGKAMTEELLQLSDRGVPIIATLAKGLGVSKERIFELASKGKISFGILQKAMIKMTEKGGIFFEQTKKQSGSLGGIFSTLKDNITIALADIGDQLVETFDLKEVLKDTIAFIQRATKGLKEFVKVNPILSKTIIIAVALSAALAPIVITLGLMVAAFAALSIPIAALSLPVIALIGVLTTALGLIFKLRSDMDSLQQNEFVNKTINAETDKTRQETIEILRKKGSLNPEAEFDALMTKVAGQSMRVLPQGAGTKTRLDGNININAPKGVVGSADAKVSGAIGNLGLSMAGAG